MQKIKRIASEFLINTNADHIAVGVVNFSDNTFDSFELIQRGEVFESEKPFTFFDLASLSKPLTMALATSLNPDVVDEKMMLLLNHRGGLPAWGLLPKVGWKELISSYEIKESETLYSDFSALRFMLEFNKKSDVSVHDAARKCWSSEILFWKNLSDEHCPQLGYKRGAPNVGVVHDPNAYVINDYVSHSGLFGTITGVCETLVNWNKEASFVKKTSDAIVEDKYKHRFILGWDRVIDPKTSLAGNGCSQQSFGHLGFTGTSIWIDPCENIGHIILTNTAKEYWYDKTKLNELRKKVGELIWKG